MSPLPTELLISICSLLKTKEEVKTFRLIDKTCAAVGLEYLIPLVTVVVRSSSIARLESISTHPVLFKRVRALKLHVDLIPPYASLGPWRKQARIWRVPYEYLQGQSEDPEQPLRTRLRSQASSRSLEYTPKCSSSGWSHYQRLVQDQKDLLTSPQLLKTLETSIARFSNLEEISVECTGFKASTATAMLFHDNPKDKCHTINSVFDYRSSIDFCIRLFPVLLRCIRKANFKLQELRLDAFDWRILNLPDSCFTKFGSTLSSLAFLDFHCSRGYPSLSSLTNIPSSSTLPMHDDVDEAPLGTCLDNMGVMLAQAKKLYILSLDFSCVSEPWDVHAHSLLRDTIWHHLRMLNLAEISISAEHFLPFLREHDGILERLTFERVWLDDDSTLDEWPAFFEAMCVAITIESTAFYGVLFSSLWPPLNPDRRLLLQPDIPVGRAIRYLTCQQKTDEWDSEDELAKSGAPWDTIGFEDIEDGYSDDEE